MLQPTQITLGATAGSGNVRGLELVYPATGNNGNLKRQTISGSGLSTNAEQNYQYDQLNRIQNACEGTNCPATQGAWGRTFDYDRYGNGWVSSWNTIPPSTVTPQTQSAYDATTNRMLSMTPDEAGNQTAVGGSSFTYDGESRMRRSMVNRQPVYQYDGEGRRVMKVDCALGASTCDSTTPEAESTWFVYDAQGRLAAEYTNGVSPAPPCTTCYLMTDHLGSTRVVTDGTTGVALQCHDYLPFGEEIPAPVGGRTGCYASMPGTGLLFTGKERDAETQNSAMPGGLDYFGARYFSAAQGRFTSPDPDNYDARLEQPLSWNMYGYTWNNPLKYTDNDGRAVNLALAGIGAGVGFGTGFVGSAVSQYIQGGTVDWRKAAAYGAGGAVSGATAGFTFGGSLLVAAFAEVGVATAGNVAGGITARTLSGEDAFDSDSMSTDAQVGLVGGFIGSTVQNVGTAIAVPIRPKVPTPLASVRTSLKRMAKLRAWEAAKKSTDNRFSAVGASLGSVFTNVITQVNSAWENRQNYLSSLWFEFASRQQQTPDVKSKICYAGEAGCPANP